MSTSTRLQYRPDTIAGPTIQRRWLPAYPLAVDETIARLTAGQVVVLNALALATRQWWLLALVAGDYAIRAAVGPRFSPLARVGALVARRLNLPARRTPAPPKRFAATIGGTFMITAITLGLVGQPTAAMVVGGVMVLLPAIESILGFCVGCAMFGQLMRLGLVPERVCLACADVRAGLR